MYDACFHKAKPDCLKRIVEATINIPVVGNASEVEQHIRSLNGSQQRAVQSFIAASNHSTTLLQGPPGTGKTTTIVKLLQVLSHKNQRTLVCAPSNKAVQVLAERYLQDHPDIPVILASIESKISEKLRPICLHTWRDDLRKTFSTNLDSLLSYLNPSQLLQSDDSKKGGKVKKEAQYDKDKILDLLRNAKAGLALVEAQIRKYGFSVDHISSLNQLLDFLKGKTSLFNFSQEDAFTLFKEHIKSQLVRRRDRVLQLPVFTDCSESIEKQLLNQSKILFATLSVAGRVSMLDEEIRRVDALIVDEAGQSVEAETLIALQHMPSKVLLVGDTKQLPATVMSQCAKEKRYDRSMMERLEQNHQPSLMLQTQYRMDPQICVWPSNQYYNGRLQTDPALKPSSKSDITQAIAFYDISTGEESKSVTSRKNDQEANYVLQTIRHIRKTDPVSHIGVITFYAAQVEAIEEMLKRENRPIKQNVTVNTVDGFQGDEREIIILSSVCANNRKDIGFLNDPRRLNVAITRAKHTLIVLGHARTLESQESDLKAMIVNLKVRGKFFSEQQLNQFLGNEIQTKAAATRNKTNNKKETLAPAVAAIKEQPRPQSAPALSVPTFLETTSKLESLSLAENATTAQKKNNTCAEQQEKKGLKKQDGAITKTEKKTDANNKDAASKSKQKREISKKYYKRLNRPQI